jgi:hypothetical protein
MNLLKGMKFLAPHLYVLGRYEWKPGRVEPLDLQTPRWGMRLVDEWSGPKGPVMTLRDDTTAIINSLGLAVGSPNIRWPKDNVDTHKIFYDRGDDHPDRHDGWHYDRCAEGDAVITWASREPTEFLLPGGKIIQPEPFEIVIALNSAMEHRVPPKIGDDRWFCRWFVKAPEWLL